MKLIKRLIGPAIILTMFTIVVFNFAQEQVNDSRANKEEEFDGVAVAVPDEYESENQTSVEIGETAPDFTLHTLEGEQVKLSELNGEKVMLNFWATWCKPCRKEMPEMQKFHEKYGDKMNIIAVNATGYETSENNVQDFVNKYHLTFPVPLDQELTVTMDQYQVFNLPSSYFINTEGKVIEKYSGSITFEVLKEKMSNLQ
ncbi:hypothetical protein GCM10008986_24050 [Salinibacillus aidingensis]|uniref:Thioredoxin domain-containing protein n=1 Tax=Salinibacillus aidingensis TaxID=237684 RepID=A0ABN1BFH6_9BACI